MEKKGRKLIWRFVRINKGRIILAAVFALIAAVSQAFLPTQIQKIGDYIQENMGGDFEFDGILPYMLICCISCSPTGVIIKGRRKDRSGIER